MPVPMDLIATLCPNSHGNRHPTETHILGKFMLKTSDAKKWNYSLLLITYAMFYLFIYVPNILKVTVIHKYSLKKIQRA